MKAHLVAEATKKLRDLYRAPDTDRSEIQLRAGDFLDELLKAIMVSVKFQIPWSTIQGMEVEDEWIPLPFKYCYFELLGYEGENLMAVVAYQVDDDTIGLYPFSGKTRDPHGLDYSPQGWTAAVYKDADGKPYYDYRNTFEDIVEEAEGSKGGDDAKAADFLVWMVRATCALLACSNIEYEDNAPPERLNKKRTRRDKVPLFTYKTLVLRQNEKRHAHSNEHSDRSGPRLHLRRGHIRRCASGKRAWVSPCIVGDNERGFVHKGYLVRRGNS